VNAGLSRSFHACDLNLLAHLAVLWKSCCRSKIVFETAGILLEELRVNGIAALARYKVVILDEVHERSVESDMVLTCVKQLMLRNPKIRYFNNFCSRACISLLN